MRIFSRGTLLAYGKKEPNSLQQLLSWFKLVSSTEFKTPNEIINMFKTADIIGDGIVVFNIAGNNYRLVVRFNYEYQAAYILFVGTHKEYDKVDIKNL